jgi:small subunit ribosomal protein S8
MTDTIADMLIRIKNAYLARKDTVALPKSKSKLAMANVLLEAGYLSEVSTTKNERGQENLLLGLKYINDTPSLTNLKRVSKPGCRVYVNANKIPAVLQGYGLCILSTNQGILAGTTAKAKGLGGELLCEVW